MSNFKVGEKVVCIDNTPKQIQLKELGFIYPKNNEIYTVRGFTPSGTGIFLEEIINLPMRTHSGMAEIGFEMRRFRKLDHQFAEDLCKELAKQVKEEQLILN